MIKKRYRFHGRVAVGRVYRSSQSVSCGPLRLWHRDGPTNKMAVVVSKKIAKSAVKRNRIRRKIYELYRVEFFLDITKNQEVILGVYSDTIADMDYSELRSLLGGCFEKAGLLNSDTN